MTVEQVHRRRSLRLRGYDYTRRGAYFVTICTQERRRVFGTVVNGRMALSAAGRMVQRVWDELPAHYPGVATDAFVVMPDHVHGVVWLCDAGLAGGAGPGACPPACRSTEGQAQGPVRAMALADVVHRFKSLTTRRYIDGVEQHGWPRFPGRLWHRNYYDTIVRDAAALTNIRAYIRQNPAHWDVTRYGAPRFMVGNRALLDLPKTAFLASRGGDETRVPRAGYATPACIISGFLSPMERAMFAACMEGGIAMVQVLGRGLPTTLAPRGQAAIDAGLLLVMTPFPASQTGFSAARAAWCNEYALDAAQSVVIGQLAPDGMLACLLADLPDDKPVVVLHRLGEAAGDS
jgi:REP element-mobilizing transposase RayT